MHQSSELEDQFITCKLCVHEHTRFCMNMQLFELECSTWKYGGGGEYACPFLAYVDVFSSAGSRH